MLFMFEAIHAGGLKRQPDLQSKSLRPLNLANMLSVAVSLLNTGSKGN